jgi:pectate lyase
VRYGQVHVYNNHYKVSDEAAAELYVLQLGRGRGVADICAGQPHSASAMRSRRIFSSAASTARRSTSPHVAQRRVDNSQVDPVAEFNAVNGNVLSGSVQLDARVCNGPVEPARTVPVSVIQGAGPFK